MTHPLYPVYPVYVDSNVMAGHTGEGYLRLTAFNSRANVEESLPTVEPADLEASLEV